MGYFNSRRLPEICITVLVLLNTWTSLGFGQLHSKDFLVCKPIGSLFEMQLSSTEINATSLRGIQGPPGKIGPRGFPGSSGPVGPQGPQAKIDWKRIEKQIDMKIKELTLCPGVILNGSCYWLPWTVASFKDNKGKAAAESVCAFYNATLADVESEEMYEQLYAYIQRAWNLYIDKPTVDFVYVWLASIYGTDGLRSSTGVTVFAQWYPGYPSGMHQGIGWSIATRATRGSKIGMFNYADLTYKWPVPLCRIQTQTTF